MSAKAPIYLKRGSRRGKRGKLRDVLSSDMISPPLGDFRHTIHIGSGGGEDDLFGDLSFLQGKFHLLPGQLGDGQQGEPFQFTRTGSVCGPPPSSEGSPLLKNAISLPVIGGVQALTLPASAPAPPQTLCQAPPPKPPRLHLEDRALPPAQSPSPPGALTLPSSRASPEPAPALLSPEDTPDKPYLSHAGSLLSLHLDLGPSILDDVLQIMDKHSVGSMNSSCVRGSRHEIFT